MEEKKIVRILHIVTSMGLGGIETFLMTMYRNINRDEFQFDFLFHRREKSFFDDEITELGGKIHRIIPLSPLTFFSYQKQFKKILIENDYQIIHSHLNANSAITLGLAKKYKIENRIAHSHIDVEEGKGIYLKKILKNYVNSVATQRLACSKKAGKWLFKNKKFLVLKNAINSKKFEFSIANRNTIRKELGVDSKTLIVGNIARFNVQKNHVFLIDIFYQLNLITNDVKLLLIGDGDLRNTIEDKVEKLKLKDKVIFAGYIGNPNEYMSTMDVFLFPSLFEGLGIVIVEAQANGLPVLMSNTIPKEAILTNLVELESLDSNPKIWAEKILKMSNQHIDRFSYNQDIVDIGYDVKENAQQLLKFYTSLL